MTGVEEAQKELRAEDNLGLVRTFARKYAGRGVEYDDLYGAGCLGLCKAVRSFDPSRGFSFSTYAVPVIVGEMKRLFRDDGTVSVSRRLKELYLRVTAGAEVFRSETGREPRLSELAEKLGETEQDISLALQAASPPLSLSFSDADEEEETLDIPVAGEEEALLLRLSLEGAVNKLPEPDRTLIRLRYFASFSQQKTAEALSMTQVQVSRRERRILDTLRRDLQE